MIPILGGALVAILGFLGFVATRPNKFRVERRAHIKAPPDRVFAKIRSFREWEAWSPWEKLDPDMKRTFDGETYSWQGNKKVGRGRMEITSAEPPRRININLDFFEPWEAHNKTEFLIEPKDGGSDVTWSMTGDSPFMSKLFGVFMSMDKLVGTDFEKGLDGLKRVTES